MEEKIDIGKLIRDTDHYQINRSEGKTALIFTWKKVAGLSIGDFKMGITELAEMCKRHPPDQVLFDARKLEHDGSPVTWVSGQKQFPGEEEYIPWWIREIVPIYNDCRISSLAIATGDPQAPGEVKRVPQGVNFKIGYYTDLESAMKLK